MEDEIKQAAKDNFAFLNNWYTNRPILTEILKNYIFNGGINNLKRTRFDYIPDAPSLYNPETNQIIIGKLNNKTDILHEMTHSLSHGTKDFSGETETEIVPKDALGRYRMYESPYYGIASFMVPGGNGSKTYLTKWETSVSDNLSIPNFYNDSIKKDLSNTLNYYNNGELKSDEDLNNIRFKLRNVGHDDHLSEQYARLMQLRQANNIDPKKVNWTLEEIKALRSNPELKDFNIFNRYTDEYILNMFNNWAYNNKFKFKISDNTYLAKSGGTLNYFNYFK